MFSSPICRVSEKFAICYFLLANISMYTVVWLFLLVMKNEIECYVFAVFIENIPPIFFIKIFQYMGTFTDNKLLAQCYTVCTHCQTHVHSKPSSPNTFTHAHMHTYTHTRKYACKHVHTQHMYCSVHIRMLCVHLKI